MFEEMLQEKEEIAAKRKRCKEILRVLQQAAWVPTKPLHSDKTPNQVQITKLTLHIEIVRNVKSPMCIHNDRTFYEQNL